jgi:hypothetical protein
MRWRPGVSDWPVPLLLIASVIFAWAIGLFLLARRVAGALSEPPPLQLFATVAGLVAWLFIVRILSERHKTLSWATLPTLVLFAVACSTPANRLVDWIAWLPALALVIAWGLVERRAKWQPRERMSLAPTKEIAGGELVLQQLTRVRTPEGKEAIRGILTASFSPGERQTTVYVGFCPPFEVLPEMEASAESELEADVKLMQVLHNGAQIDVRLGEPAEETIAVAVAILAIEGS